MLSEKWIRKELAGHQGQETAAKFGPLINKEDLAYVKGYINALKFVLEEL